MIKKLLIVPALCVTAGLFGQNASYTETFHDFDTTRIHNASPVLHARVANNEISINCSGKESWEDTRISVPAVDFSSSANLSFRVKSDVNVTVRVDLVETSGTGILVSNAIPVSKSIKGDGNWNYIFFDFTGHFDQAWPSHASLNPKNINGIDIILNPGGLFKGTVTIDSLFFGQAAQKPRHKRDAYIAVNQIGYYPGEKKVATICGSKSSSFEVYTSDKKRKVFGGKLSESANWSYADDSVRTADFSSLSDTGTFVVFVPGMGYSHPFKISRGVLQGLAASSLKSFYFQRSSLELEPKYAGKWARPLGTADTAVFIHPSAASKERPGESKISSSRGWYDAGDYNKYIVNSGITMHSLLSIMEQYPQYAQTIATNIPESSNKLPDLLDEILWNLRWMLTMQDPNDGGVYHKLTHPNFEGMVLPDKVTDQKRYVIQKSTAATLDFCAVMAQASRVLKPYKKELPGLADSCMIAASKAFVWAKKNPRIYYDQFGINQRFQPAINTGAYGDGYLIDEFEWAASEMFISTGNEQMLQDIRLSGGTKFTIPNWSNVQTLALMSLCYYREFLNKQIDTALVKEKLLGIADSLVAYYKTSPFNTTMGQADWNFSWGSNSIAANASLLLLQAYNVNKDRKYYEAALGNLNYLLGNNPTGYCFVTGEGSKSPQFLHHRLSQGDTIAEPVPGLIVGGPQPGREDGCWYPWEAPAKNYSDDLCSYSTNEVAINWNAPLVNIAFAFEAIEHDKVSNKKPNPRTRLVFPDLSHLPKQDSLVANEYNPIIAYPNLKTGSIRVLLAILDPSTVEIRDGEGRVLVHEVISQTGSIPRNYPVNLKAGTYVISIDNKVFHKTHTIMINQ